MGGIWDFDVLTPGLAQKLSEGSDVSANPPWRQMLASKWLRCGDLPAGQGCGTLRGCAPGWLQETPTGPCPGAEFVLVVLTKGCWLGTGQVSQERGSSPGTAAVPLGWRGAPWGKELCLHKRRQQFRLPSGSSHTLNISIP